MADKTRDKNQILPPEEVTLFDDEAKLNFLCGVNPPPLSQSYLQKFQIPAKEVVASQKQVYTQSAPFTENPFRLKQPGCGLMDESSVAGAPASGKSSSYYSRNDTEYHHVLLTWARLWPQDLADHVVTQVVHLKGCISVRVFLSPKLAKTLVHVLFDENRPGFKRDYFTHGRKS